MVTRLISSDRLIAWCVFRGVRHHQAFVTDDAIRALISHPDWAFDLGAVWEIRSGIGRLRCLSGDLVWTPASRPHVGVGDTVAGLARLLRLDRVAAWLTSITGKPCGCDTRRRRLNTRFPYRWKPLGKTLAAILPTG